MDKQADIKNHTVALLCSHWPYKINILQQAVHIAQTVVHISSN